MTNIINEMKQDIIQAAANAGEGHVPSAFSILDILWVLYDQILRISSSDPENIDRDRFILSKGHASLGHYAVLAQKGFISKTELLRFGKYDSILGGHSDRNKVPGVEASTGSLGHGFPIAVGIALSLKIQKRNPRVYVLVGDGELNEGATWEAVMLAAHHKLSNLCCIVDYNHSTDRALLLGDIYRKFEAFSWQGSEIDGHNHDEIKDTLSQSDGELPRVVVARTIKGKGIEEMEHNPAWHHRAPNVEETNRFSHKLS